MFGMMTKRKRKELANINRLSDITYHALGIDYDNAHTSFFDLTPDSQKHTFANPNVLAQRIRKRLGIDVWFVHNYDFDFKFDYFLKWNCKLKQPEIFVCDNLNSCATKYCMMNALGFILVCWEWNPDINLYNNKKIKKYLLKHHNYMDIINIPKKYEEYYF